MDIPMIYTLGSKGLSVGVEVDGTAKVALCNRYEKIEKPEIK